MFTSKNHALVENKYNPSLFMHDEFFGCVRPQPRQFELLPINENEREMLRNTGSIGGVSQSAALRFTPRQLASENDD